MVSLVLDHVYSHLDFRLQLDVQQESTYESSDYQLISVLYLFLVLKDLLAYVVHQHHLQYENEEDLLEVGRDVYLGKTEFHSILL